MDAIRNIRAAGRYLIGLCLLPFVLALGGCGEGREVPDAPIILVPASMAGVMDELVRDWANQGHVPPVIVTAGSHILAKQIFNGVEADVFVSADERWMDEVEGKGHLVSGTRRDFAANRLVLISPRKAIEGGDLVAILQNLGDRKVAMGDPEVVPAGRYGKEAMENLGVWERVRPSILGFENVRLALAVVARNEAELGVVYASDAAGSKDVRVVGVFPTSNHRPIHYPAAVLKVSKHKDARAFLDYLATDRAGAILIRNGFEVPNS